MKDDIISEIPTFIISLSYPLLGAPPITPIPQYSKIAKTDKTRLTFDINFDKL
jgi:hypothetical protein